MVAVIVVFLIAACFGLVGAFIGYYGGFDEGWAAAEECFEQEVKNGIQSRN